MPVISQTDAFTERVSRLGSHFNDRLTSGSYQKASIFDVHFPVMDQRKETRGIYYYAYIYSLIIIYGLTSTLYSPT